MRAWTTWLWPLRPWAPLQGRRSLATIGRQLNVSVRATPNPLAKEFFIQGVPLLSQPDLVLRFQPDRVPGDLHHASPLAAKLVGIDGVSEVLLASDSVTVNAAHPALWDMVELQVQAIVKEALRCGSVPESGIAALSALSAPSGAATVAWPEGSVEAEIVEVLEEHVRPYVREDGGDLRFVAFDHDSGAARVQLIGACSGCPSSAATLHGRVEQLLKHFVPEVTMVEQAADDEAEAAAVAASMAAGMGAPGAAAAGPLGGEKVPIEEHIRRMMAEGEATSVVWDEVLAQQTRQSATRDARA